MTAQAAPAAQQAGWLRAAGRDYRTPFHVTAALLMIALLVVEAVLARALHFSGMSEIFKAWPSALLGLACVWYTRWRPLPKAIESAELAVLAVIFTNILTILIQLAGRSPHPLFDEQFAAMDRWAHFSTLYWTRVAAGWPIVRAALAMSYNLAAPMIFLATLVPPFFSQRSASRQFILGIVVAAIATAAIFWAWPAVGPWTTEGYAPTREQSAVTAYLERLRSSLPVYADMQDAGIVSFPSFHVVLAVLAAYALRRIRILCVFAWIACGLICVSTISTGWHYGVDVVAGLALSALSIAAVSWVE
jgi:membrane-associated phospholipid phosphatase